MSIAELGERMEKWLHGEYRAIIFSDTEPVAYALFRKSDALIHLRQFFVRSERRRTGIGRRAFGILRDEIWPPGLRLTVDVLCHNPGGLAFWRSVGYRDYRLTLEIVPP